MGRARNSRAFAIVTGRIRIAVTAASADEALCCGLRAWAARSGGEIAADNCGRIVVVVDERDPDDELYVLTQTAMERAGLAPREVRQESGATEHAIDA